MAEEHSQQLAKKDDEIKELTAAATQEGDGGALAEELGQLKEAKEALEAELEVE